MGLVSNKGTRHQMVEHGELLFPLDNDRAPLYKPHSFIGPRPHRERDRAGRGEPAKLSLSFKPIPDEEGTEICNAR